MIMRRFSDDDINIVLITMSDEMAKWYRNNDLTFTEKMFAEDIEKIIAFTLNIKLKEIME